MGLGLNGSRGARDATRISEGYLEIALWIFDISYNLLLVYLKSQMYATVLLIK